MPAVIRQSNLGAAGEIKSSAEVAELADALRSGRSEGSLVWVRLPPSALFHEGKPHSSRGPGRRPLKAVTRVRIPYAAWGREA